MEKNLLQKAFLFNKLQFPLQNMGTLILLFLFWGSMGLKGQNTEQLEGFDESAVLKEFRKREGSELKYPDTYSRFLDFKKQEFINSKKPPQQKALAIPNPPTIASGECGNIDFETGDFTDWSGKTGGNPGCCGTNGFVSNGLNAGVNDAAARHTIVSGTGNDPCGGFSVVAPAIPGQSQGTYSCRLGNAVVGAQAEQIEIQFTPTATNNIFTYQYAAVLQNAGHGQADQPFFKVTMLDSNGDPIPCTTITYIAEFGQTADDFLPSPNCPGVSYLPWSTVSVDLVAHIGNPVTIRFTSADCTAGGHYGYGYLNAECSELTVVQTDSLCAGGSVTLTAPLEADNTYSWTGPGGPYTGQIINVTQPGQYDVTMVSATGCVKLISYVVTQYPTAILDPIADVTICSNQDATLSAAIAGAATGGTWTGGAGTYSPSNTSLNITYTPSAAEITAGTATLIFTTNNPAGPCPATSDTAVITINPQATVSAGSDQSICTGSTVTLNGSFGGAATSGTWTGGTGTYAPNSTTAGAVYTPGAAEETAGTVTLTFTTDDPAGACPAVNDQMTITIFPLAFVNVIPDQTICSDESATLTATPSGAATSGTWSGGAGVYTPSNTSLNATYTPSAAEITAGTVTLVFTTNDPIGPCPGVSDTVKIIINPQATINAGPDQTICFGNSVILAGTVGGGANSGFWTGGAGTYAPNNTTSSAVYTPTTTEATGGSVTLIFTSDDPAGPCPAVTDTMVVTINQMPTANAGSAQYVCVGSPLNLSGSVGGTATSGTWSGGSGTFSPNNTTLNAVYTPTAAEYAADSVLLTLTTDDPVGPCTFSSSSVKFHFYQNPVVSFTADDPDGCPIHCVNFTDATTVGGAGATLTSWTWDFGDGSAGSSGQNPSNCFTDPGFYDIKLIVETNQGCTSFLTIPQMIEVYNVPVAEFTPSPSNATVINPVITFLNGSSPDVNYWGWIFGDGDSLIPGTPSPVHEYPHETYASYLVTLMVENANGCMDTIAHPVFIGPEFTFFIPNAFTPNGDGINDYFFGSGIGIEKYDMWIFDRWGNMVFHADDLEDTWDGRSNYGKDPSQIDVFVWKVELTDVFKKVHNYIGTVTIAR